MRKMRGVRPGGRTRRAMPVRAAAGGGGGGNPGVDAWVDSGAVSTRGGGVDDFIYMIEGPTDHVVGMGYERIFKSTDGGATMTEYTVTGSYYQIAYSPGLDRYVQWRQSTGLWYSSDAISWTQSNVTSGISGDVKWVPWLNEFIAFAFNRQPRFSADGITWSAETASCFIRNTTQCFVGPNEMIFNGSSSDFNRRSVGKLSTDFTTMTGLAFTFQAAWCGTFGWRAFPIGVNQGFYESTNAAAWTNKGNVLPSNQVWQGLAYDSSRERIWIVGDNGATHYSDDGGDTWSADQSSGVSPTFALVPYTDFAHLNYLPNADQLWCGTDKLVHSP